MVFDDVKAYIDEAVFHSSSFDKLDDTLKRKAVKNAESILYTMFKSYKPDVKPLPVEAIAYQTIWILRKDASVQKAEIGVSSQAMEGMSVSFTAMDRTIAPEVKQILRKRVGSYSVTLADTNRGVYDL